MINEIQIENFRCFKERTIFPLSNISLIYGDNNSGKTTFLRALSLLKETFSQPSGLGLRIPSEPYNLGDTSTLHWKHQESNYQEIKFRIACDSLPDYKTYNNFDSIELVYDKSLDGVSDFYALKKIAFHKEGDEVLFLHTQEGEDGYSNGLYHLLGVSVSSRYLENFITNELPAFSEKVSSLWYTDSLAVNLRPMADFFIQNFLIKNDDSEGSLSMVEKIAFLECIICFSRGELGEFSHITSLFLDRYIHDEERGESKELPERSLEIKKEYSVYKANEEKIEYLKTLIGRVKEDYQDFLLGRHPGHARDMSFNVHELVELISNTEDLNETILNFRYFIRTNISNLLTPIRDLSLTSTIQASNQRFYERSDPKNSDLLKLGELFDKERVVGKQNYGFLPTKHTFDECVKKIGLPFEVIFETAFDGEVFRILLEYENGSRINLNDAGFGIYQLIKALVTLCIYNLDTSPHHPLIALEEPEVHLNPKMQIKFVNLLIDLATPDEDSQFKQVILDTHMEVAAYALLDRISKSSNKELGRGESSLNPHNVQFLKVEYLPDEKYSIVHPISAGKYGTFSPPWPGGFFKLDDLG